MHRESAYASLRPINPTTAKDPYLRCTWDNMVMLSPVVKQSLRPVFNQSFYFPVRVAGLKWTTS